MEGTGGWRRWPLVMLMLLVTGCQAQDGAFVKEGEQPLNELGGSPEFGNSTLMRHSHLAC